MHQPIITLLSDLGTKGPAVAMARAALRHSCPGAVMVDMTHKVARSDLRQAAYLLHCAYPHYPARTVHLVMTDVFAANPPRIVLVEKDGHFFIAPDNGILPFAFGEAPFRSWLCHDCGSPCTFGEWMENASAAIHAVLQGGTLPYAPHVPHKAPDMLRPQLLPDGIECHIRYIDRYENVALDITRSQFEDALGSRRFRIKTMRPGDIMGVSNNYNDVPQGAPLCRFNCAGYLEIAINHGSAAAMLGLTAKNATDTRYRTIKIFTELAAK